MLNELNQMFSMMIGTLAVILLIAAFIGSSDFFSKLLADKSSWKYTVFTAVLGGVLGIYGNISGFSFNGAVISVRDIGPMLSGVLSGPVGGLLAGLIAGGHRLTLGGITAHACMVATCCIGVICGLIARAKQALIAKPLRAFLLSALMECFHLLVVLAMVKPFDTAYGIVRRIAVPFIAVNALGFMLMVTIINYTRKQRTLALERNRLQSELAVANVIQHSLLPLISDSYPGRNELDVSALMEAAKEVGGDFYDVFFVDSNRLAFVVGDVSGKGVPAALFMASAKITLQNCIRDIPRLSDAIAAANNALCARNEAEMFVTLWVGVLDLGSNELTYVSAGHNPPVLVSSGKAEYLRGKCGFVLAGLEDTCYRERTLQLQRGDMMYLYTDGVTEAETAQHELFGEDRLLNCFAHAEGATAAEMIETVKTSVDSFVGGNDQFDDMTMLCFKLK
ncbi:MAG: SpoIIE family protein phosphatase [Oscillospiraceae bacterium]|nr:SpoIIE family protein phosphatase [Oscillospiraceae bacterium]